MTLTAEQLAEAQQAIVVAKARYPTLIWNGFHVPKKILGYDDSGQLNGPPADYQVATALAFLRLCARTKTARYGSYGLKHVAEHWGQDHEMSPYVSNGALIVAAVYLDIPIRHDAWSPNAGIGVSRASVRLAERSERSNAGGIRAEDASSARTTDA